MDLYILNIFSFLNYGYEVIRNLQGTCLSSLAHNCKCESWQALIGYSTHDFRSTHTEQFQGIMDVIILVFHR
jgi:hypothetical protein